MNDMSAPSAAGSMSLDEIRAAIDATATELSQLLYRVRALHAIVEEYCDRADAPSSAGAGCA